MVPWPKSSAWPWLAFVIATMAAPAPSRGAMAPFEKVRDKLLRAKSATVSAACGTASYPWAYRGARGDSLALKTYVRAEMDERWAKRLVNLLMTQADWDSSQRFRGRTKRCRETHTVPHFAVAWHVQNVDHYALFSFESRSALVFTVDGPLGTVWLRDRADSLYRSIRAALPADTTMRSMPSLAAIPDARPDSVVQPQELDALPAALTKVPPVYPNKAREEGWEGTVMVQVLVGTDGRVRDAFVEKSVQGLDDAALDCIWDWKFRPAQRGGKPVPVWVMVPIKFRLE